MLSEFCYSLRSVFKLTLSTLLMIVLVTNIVSGTNFVSVTKLVAQEDHLSHDEERRSGLSFDDQNDFSSCYFSLGYFGGHDKIQENCFSPEFQYKGSYGRLTAGNIWTTQKPVSLSSSENFYNGSERYFFSKNDLGSNFANDLGSNFGSNLGNNLGSNLGSNLGNNFGSNFGNNLGSNLGNNLGSNFANEPMVDYGKSEQRSNRWSSLSSGDLSSLYEINGNDSSEDPQYRGQEKNRSNFSDEELSFAHWDFSLHSLIPGKGPKLPLDSSERWQWQWLPNGVLYRAYFASNRESRLAIHLVHEDNRPKDFWDPTLGGRFPVIRYGNFSRLYPEGFQFDLEAAVIGRLTLDRVRDLYSSDYRFGAPLTFRKGHLEYKLGYYHISSHMGDEQVVNVYKETGQVYRINYSRDCIMFGIAWRPDANWRFYWGGDYAFRIDGGAQPWQLEMGAEYSPILLPGFRGSPFAALHLKWNEETDWDTYTAFEIGWQWKTTYQHTLRTGLYLMSGYADQYQFYNQREKQIGYGLWIDF